MKAPWIWPESDAPPPPEPVFLRFPDPAPTITPMTVGIGAICDDGKAIVMAADRLCTVGEAGLVTELGVKKLIPLTPHVMVTVTGTIQDSEYVSERLRHASNLLTEQSVHRVAK